MSVLLVGKLGRIVLVEAILFYFPVQHSTYYSHYVDLTGETDLGHLAWLAILLCLQFIKQYFHEAMTAVQPSAVECEEKKRKSERKKVGKIIWEAVSLFFKIMLATTCTVRGKVTCISHHCKPQSNWGMKRKQREDKSKQNISHFSPWSYFWTEDWTQKHWIAINHTCQLGKILLIQDHQTALSSLLAAGRIWQNWTTSSNCDQILLVSPMILQVDFLRNFFCYCCHHLWFWF